MFMHSANGTAGISAEAGSSILYKEVDDVVSSELTVEVKEARAALGGLPSPVLHDFYSHSKRGRPRYGVGLFQDGHALLFYLSQRPSHLSYYNYNKTRLEL